MQPLVLVLDQGGHSSRALVFDEAGRILAQATCAVDTAFPRAGWVEQDPAQLLSSLRQVVEGIAQQLASRCHHIASAALIVQRASLLAWNPCSGEILSPVLSWQDTRHAAWLAEHVASCGDWLRTSTGLYANAHYGASKMRWLLDHSHTVQQALQEQNLCIGPLAAFLQQQLTHSPEPMIDAVVASRTLLTRLGDIDWCDALLRFFLIPRAILPAISSGLADYGQLHCGDACIPLRLLGGDQSFFAFAQGELFDESTALINVGTGAFVQQRMAVEQIPSVLLASPLLLSTNPQQSAIVAEGTVNAAATALDWWAARHGATLSDATFSAMRTEINAGPQRVPVFVNRIAGTGSPDWLPVAESYFVALPGSGQPGGEQPSSSPMLELAAVLEAIVFALQRNVEQLARVRQQQRVVISGGLSRLDIFCQCLADVAGLPVWRSHDTEACARGAAMQLLPAMREHLPAHDVFEPRADPSLRARYRFWSSLMDHFLAK